MGLLGGYSDAKKPDAELSKFFDDLKPELETAANSKFSTWEVVQYTQQVVAGTNYKVKAKVGDNDYIHFTVFQPLPNGGQKPEVKSVEKGKTLESSL